MKMREFLYHKQHTVFPSRIITAVLPDLEEMGEIKNMEEFMNMNKKDMMLIKESLTMPAEMAAVLTETAALHGNRRSRPGHFERLNSFARCRYRRLTAAAAALFCIFAVGSTSLAYNVYQEKQLAVFMDAGLSQKEIDRIGQEIAGICEISDCQSVSLRYVNGDEAWEEFKAAYFTDENGEEMTELTEGIGENPLADSFNYRVSVRMSADTQAVREQIAGLPGVRKVTTVREAETGRGTGT